ncbi:unnamed protein product [Clavelina lepadiformis]|uniref:Myotubularin phosphatase domain-containing protein n=1 Tax=Clavelina lepadiformis TaxID=159417 RepID=A0ABP0GU42_CLALP
MSSFTSYVSQAEEENRREKKLSLAYDKIYGRPDEEVNEKLLPGEIAISVAKQVIKYCVHDDPSKGVSGTLICTNFRLIFISPDKPESDLTELRSRFLGKQDISLSGIDSINVEYSNSKQKKLVPSSNIKDGIKRLEIHCKNFRISAFNFKFTMAPEGKGVVTAILHHAYPANVNLLFAFDYDPGKDFNEDCTIPLFRNYRDWQVKLEEHNMELTWRVSSVNQNFTTSETMGEFLVVPITLTDNELRETANQYYNNRLPAWCWSSPTGCTLTRSAELRSETEFVAAEKKFYSAIQKAGPNGSQLKIIDLSELCPTHSQLQQSFTKLKNNCTPATEEDYWHSDSAWILSLHHCKWLQHISTVLNVASEAAKCLVERNQNVMIREQSGIDLSPAVTSLVQVMVDPVCRTLDGFQALVQREWVVGGYPFLVRLGHLNQPMKQKTVNSVITATVSDTTEPAQKMSPVFLFFLDCVWQLMRQHPSAFEFSSTFLTVLYDGTRVPIFDTFIFNNERHRQRSIKASERCLKNSSWETLPIWNWHMQFDKNDMKLFNNPLYRVQLSGLHTLCDSVLSPPGCKKSRVNLPLRLDISMDSLGIENSNSSLPSPSSFPDLRKKSLPMNSFNQSLLDVPLRNSSASEELQLHYNSQTGVMAILGTETPENDKKKKIGWSLRRKRSGKEKESIDPESSSSDAIPAEFYHCTMQDLTRPPAAVQVKQDQIIYPQCGVANMRLWNACYLRWIAWSQLFGGGPSSIYQQESLLYDEIYALHYKVLELKKQLNIIKTNHLNSSVSSDESGMYFCHSPAPEKNQTAALDPPDTPIFLPNFYPYSPIKDINRKSVLGSPLTNFLRSSSLFSFGSRNRNKHTRSQSDFSHASTNQEKKLSVAPTSMVTSSSSDNLQEAVGGHSSIRAKPPKKALMPPNKPLVPPKEAISYVSSV